MRFTDLLSLFVGESITVRRPGAVGKKHANTCPCFYSGRTRIQSNLPDPGAAAELTRMMDERFAIVAFEQPLPHMARVPDWPACGKCAAAFFLNEGTPHVATRPAPPSSSGARPVAAHSSDIVAGLTNLADLFQGGFLQVAEFEAAKQRLLSS